MNDLVVREEPTVPEVPVKIEPQFTPTPPQKAAIILSVLDTESAVGILQEFNDLTLRHFAKAIMDLEAVTHDVLDDVIDEFLGLLGQGSGVRGGVDQAKRMLGGVMEEDKLSRLLDKLENPDKGVVWDRFSNVAPSEASHFLQLEHPQTIAFIISRIRADRAAGVLEGLPREMAQEVVLRLSRVVAPEDAVMNLVERVVANDFLSVINDRSSSVSPAEMIGNLMNNVSSSVRDEFLDYMQTENAELAQDVLKVMFTFADISTRVQPNDIAKIVKEMPEDRLIIALRYAQDQSNPSFDYILSNLSKRLSERLAEDIEALDGVKTKDGEAAQMETVNLIQAKAKSGDIVLNELDADDE